ncbi:Ecm1p NDAI_0H02030 [Naumovozyma dairenensis CBS 421]|uniref:Uncharacterized protein n=1 Tax=Naumovozyma dairenensis (strain ATCC 10597 / BCRC 20456 / CBS 421 / NBRC 0211 / NRRL Y-12639) TaxID=1071378 RepID=G0WF16_NAUDC|nr:hypothetical protein NDAI_0H02030 [Naumovozyma dairenensis CBS 421]CCD26377.1 hypothetical protein NDAI_0H02030 [Naumovozyma dairenensis CBS 421]
MVYYKKRTCLVLSCRVLSLLLLSSNNHIISYHIIAIYCTKYLYRRTYTHTHTHTHTHNHRRRGKEVIKEIQETARQAESSLIPITKDLENITRAEDTNLTNILIRTAAKNERLLEAKLKKKEQKKSNNNNNRINKKKAIEAKLSQASITSMDKERLERALHFTNRLDGKIAKSISRAKFVQSTRKAGWESTNESIKRDLISQAGLVTKNKNLHLSTTIDKNDDIEKDIENANKVALENEEGEEKTIIVDQKPIITKNLFDLLPSEIEE